MNYLVKDLMVPLSEYATVPENSTLYDAALALEKAQEAYDHTKYRHRAVLVLDSNNHVIGKLSQLDILHALDPPQDDSFDTPHIRRLGFSAKFISQLKEHHRLQDITMEKMCENAAGMKVEEFMQAPLEGEYIEEDASLVNAIHHLVMGNHMSLLVTKDNNIQGVLRLTDIFAAVFHIMQNLQNDLQDTI